MKLKISFDLFTEDDSEEAAIEKIRKLIKGHGVVIKHTCGCISKEEMELRIKRRGLPTFCDVD